MDLKSVNQIKIQASLETSIPQLQKLLIQRFGDNVWLVPVTNPLAKRTEYRNENGTIDIAFGDTVSKITIEFFLIDNGYKVI